MCLCIESGASISLSYLTASHLWGYLPVWVKITYIPTHHMTRMDHIDFCIGEMIFSVNIMALPQYVNKTLEKYEVYVKDV